MKKPPITLAERDQLEKEALAEAERYRKVWQMPDESTYLVDDDTAVMSAETLSKFFVYDCTDPTGCWPGKRWIRHMIDADSHRKMQPYLMEFVLDYADPRYCFTKWRKVLIV